MNDQLNTFLALQTAVADMPGIIPVANIIDSLGGVFTTSEPHGLSDGLGVTITGHTGISGTFRLDSVTEYTFEIVDFVSGASVDSNGQGGTVKAELTHYENTSFDPIHGTPYEECWIMFADPSNPTMGKGHYRLLGYLQISLHYPRDTGMLGITQRAELYRAVFARGTSFAKDDTVVNIHRTASIERGDPPDGYVTRIVKVPFYVDVFE